MYFKGTEQHEKRQQRRLKVRRWRQGVLLAVLLIVAVWGLRMCYLDQHTFDWTDPISVAVVALLDNVGGGGSEPDDDERFLLRFLTRSGYARHNLRQVEEWVEKEYTRHTGDERSMFDFFVRGPVRLTSSPPPLPGADASFMERLGGTNRFLDYFEALGERPELLLAEADVLLFVYFYDDYDAARRELFRNYESVATRRRRMGIVFAPMNEDLLGNTCAVVAHELLHPLGATDKYDGVSLYPEGYADPQREPLYPQRKAEIMALGIPIARGKDEPVRDLEECVVGAETALEMNWTSR